MKNIKVLSLVLALIVTLTLCVNVNAAETQPNCEYIYDGESVYVTGSTDTDTRVLLLVTDVNGKEHWFDYSNSTVGLYGFKYTFPAGTTHTDYDFTVSEFDTAAMTQTQTTFKVSNTSEAPDYMINRFAVTGSVALGDITATAEIRNTSDAAMKTPVLITAVYEKSTNHMVSASVSEVTGEIAVDSVANISVTNSYKVDANKASEYYVQAFLWEDMTSMVPILTKIIK